MTKKDFIREYFNAVWWIFLSNCCIGMGIGILFGIYHPWTNMNIYLGIAFFYLAIGGGLTFYGLYRKRTICKNYLDNKQIPF